MTEQKPFDFRKRKRAPRVPSAHRAEFKSLVRGYLETNCVGKGKAERSARIRMMCALPASETEEIVREMIRELLEEGVAVGSCSRGYFIIQSMKELGDVLKGLRARQEGIETRIRLISHAFGCNGVVS